MNESEFISSIDCCFPYGKPIQWRRASAMAPRISANAAFMVLHEICRVPRSKNLARPKAEAMIRHLQRRFRHPVLRLIQPAVLTYTSKTKISRSCAANLLRKMANHPKQYNALALCYFAADDHDGKLEALYEKAISLWLARGESHDA